MGVFDSIASAWKDRMVLECTGSKYDTRLVFPNRGVISNINYLMTVRLQLNRVDNDQQICTSKGVKKSCRAWTDTEWDKFVEDVKGLSKHWNRKLWIELPGDFNGLNRSKEDVEFRPYLCCMMAIEVIPSIAGIGIGDHHEIDVMHLADTESSIRSSSRKWDDRDVKPTSRRRLGQQIQQIISAHELGHLIGLPHVGVTKSYDECGDGDDKNASVCYGNNLDDRNNIMGSGMQISESNAKPWIDHLEKHFPGRSKTEFTAKVGNNLNALRPVKVAA